MIAAAIVAPRPVTAVLEPQAGPCAQPSTTAPERGSYTNAVLDIRVGGSRDIRHAEQRTQIIGNGRRGGCTARSSGMTNAIAMAQGCILQLCKWTVFGFLFLFSMGHPPRRVCDGQQATCGRYWLARESRPMQLRALHFSTRVQDSRPSAGYSVHRFSKFTITARALPRTTTGGRHAQSGT